MSSVEDKYLVSKDKFKHQLVIFEQLLNNGYCALDFDGLAEIIKQVSLIKIDFSDWKKNIFVHI
jgi:hypothetical protein